MKILFLILIMVCSQTAYAQRTIQPTYQEMFFPDDGKEVITVNGERV